MAEEKKEEKKKEVELDIKYGIKPTETKEVFYITNEEGNQVEITEKELLYEIYKELKHLRKAL